MADRHGIWDMFEGRKEPGNAAKTLGMRVVHVDSEGGSLTMQFEAKPEFVNPMGNIQGGFLAAMLDCTMSPALASTLTSEQTCPTLELKISFLRPAREGQITGTGRVVHKTSSVAFLEGELRDPENQVVATATATARIIRFQR
jgi:uncharacterized protein (TIGR00369 family)